MNYVIYRFLCKYVLIVILGIPTEC